MKKYFASLLILGLLVAFFVVAVGEQPQADAKASYGSNCASCHNGTVAPKLGGSTAPKPAPKPAPAKSTTTKPAASKATPAKTTTAKPAASKAAPAKTTQPAAPKEVPVKITVEGKAVKGFKLNGTVYAAIKEYAAAMGYNLGWNANTQAVVLSDFNTTLEILTTKGIIKYRGKDNKIATMTKNGASYVDIKGITELTHGKISEQNNVYTVRKSSHVVAWEQSPHNFDLKAMEETGKRDGCMTCHNGSALMDKTKKAADVTSVTPIGCNTCHGASKAVKDLRGSKPFVMPNGLTVDAGAGTICINCHNGRRNTDDVEALYSTYRAPHRGPQADLFFATGGFEFGDRAYERSPHSAIEDTCVTCHMAKQDDEYGSVGGHTFKVVSDKVANANACNSCHSDMTGVERRALGDYDGDKKLESFQAEVEGLQHLLKEAIIAKYADKGVKELVDNHGSIAYVIEMTDPEHPVALDPGVVSVDDYKATWNLFLTEDDGSMGIHNPAYTIQLLQQSYKAVTGHDVPNAVIR